MKLMLLLIPFILMAQTKNENYYAENICKELNGKGEYLFYDGTRADCLTITHVWEFDFAKKFYEAIGQSLYYSSLTGKKAGVYLILREPKDVKYLMRMQRVAKKNDIEVRYVEDYK